MEHNCERHTFEVAEGVCRSCEGSFCPDCLLYPFGPDDPPYCKPCAIAAGGVRSTAGNRPRRAADPGRAGPEAKAKRRSRGLFGRLRRREDAEEEEVLSPEELIEQEAVEARRMLDAQRLPSEPEEEPEPEPPPTPNIAPPSHNGSEPELAHRTMPDEIAGGLDLSGAEEPVPPPADDRAPAAAGPGDTESDGEPTPETAPALATTGPDDTPSWARPEAAEGSTDEVPPEPAAPEMADPEVADPASPEAVVAAVPQRPTRELDVRPGVDAPTADPLDAAPPAPSTRELDVRPVVDAPAADPLDAAPPAPAEATTADGTPLFTTASSEPDPAEDEILEPDAAIPPSGDGAAAPTPVGASAGPAVGDEATQELLRRIADLREP